MAAARKTRPIDVDANVRAVVRMLMASENLSAHELADIIDVSPRTAYSKINDKAPTPFKYSEICKLALRFGVPVDIFQRPARALLDASASTRGQSDMPLPQTARTAA